MTFRAMRRGKQKHTLAAMSAAAELHEVAGGDHSFKVLKRAGVTQEDTYKAVLDRIDQWLRATLSI